MGSPEEPIDANAEEQRREELERKHARVERALRSDAWKTMQELARVRLANLLRERSTMPPNGLGPLNAQRLELDFEERFLADYFGVSVVAIIVPNDGGMLGAQSRHLEGLLANIRPTDEARVGPQPEDFGAPQREV
jgi:hypothetical protein